MSTSRPPLEFVTKAIKVSIWGMDASMRAFVDTAQTVQLALAAVELDSPRQLTLGEIIGLGFKGQKSRFKVISSFISSVNTYRVILEAMNASAACMWQEEMNSPDVATERTERRLQKRYPVVGAATIYNAQGSTSPAKLTDISAGGCYIESYAPGAVGEEIALRISLCELQVNMEATVRTSHPAIGMGMQISRFLTPDDETRFKSMLDQVAAATG